MRKNTFSSATLDAADTASAFPSYVLVTPAWNEAAFIEKTIKSLVAQTVLPVKWVIVSDGSTDGTDEIVRKYTKEHKWIELVQLPPRAERHFAGKVNAFNAGCTRLEGVAYDIIGNVDADTSFDDDHFEFLLGKFASNPSLGVAGTAYVEGTKGIYNYEIVSVEDVSGACQLFRRECFEQIGGYTPIKVGGIDSVAVYTACMKGWKTRTFTEKTFVHYRKVGTGQNRLLASKFRLGEKDYFLGGHPLWELFRTLYQMKHRPYVVGGVLLLFGYLWPLIRGAERPISAELTAFRRNEQMQRLRSILKKLISSRGTAAPSDTMQ